MYTLSNFAMALLGTWHIVTLMRTFAKPTPSRLTLIKLSIFGIMISTFVLIVQLCVLIEGVDKTFGQQAEVFYLFLLVPVLILPYNVQKYLEVRPLSKEEGLRLAGRQ